MKEDQWLSIIGQNISESMQMRINTAEHVSKECMVVCWYSNFGKRFAVHYFVLCALLRSQTGQN